MRILLAVCLFAFASYAGAQPFGPTRTVDPAVPHRNAAEVHGVRLANGSVAYTQTDLQTAGRVMGLSMRRVWRGDMTFDGPLGKGWTCEYLQAAWRDSITADIYWHDADGFMHTFIASGGAHVTPPGVYVRATWNSGPQTVTLRKADGTVLAFNSLGQLASITDRHGNSVTLSYDGSNRLEFVTDDRGECWEFIYSSGRIVELIDHVWETSTRAARSIEYEYSSGNLVRANLPETARYNDAGSNRIAWEYSYDGTKRLTAITAPNEVLTSGPARIEYEYDSSGRVISFRDGNATAWHQLRYTVDGGSKPLVRHINPLGARVDYNIDWRGRTWRIEQFTKWWAVDQNDPIDHSHVVQAAGKVRSSDPDSYVTLRVFNAGHQLVQIEHPAGDAEQFAFPNAGVLTSGKASSIAGSVLTKTAAAWTPGAFVGAFLRLGSSLATYGYFEIADNTATTITVVGVDLAALGWGVDDRFDAYSENPDPLAAGNLLRYRRISAASEPDIVRTWTYEPYFQQVRSETSARGFTTTYEFEFDASGDPLDGNVVAKLSPQVTIILAAGTDTATLETGYTYNGYGQLTEIIDPEGAVEVRHYYSSGDQAGFLEEVIRDYGGVDLTEQFEYDKTGILTGQYPPAAFDSGADAEDFKTTWLVNELGQRWHEAARVVADDERAQVYRYYDASGNDVRTFTAYVTADGDAPCSPGDVDDPGTFSKDTTPMAATWVEVVREYDLAGRLLSETSDAIAATPIETVTWESEYDATGKLSLRTSPLGNLAGFDYDERGLLWQRIECVGTAVEGVYEHDYNANGKLAAERTPLGKETTRSHDGHGREVAVTDPEGHAREVAYDASENVVSESCVDAGLNLLAQTEFEYDELERLHRVRRLALDSADDPIGTGEADTRLTLDGRGCVVQRNDGTGRTWSFEYDGAGRQVEQTDPVGNVAAITRNAAGDPTEVEYEDWNEESSSFESALWQADYNTHGLVARIRDRRNHSGFDTEVEFAWDGWRRLVAKVDAAGIEVAYTYDLRSRPTGKVENPGGVLLKVGVSQEWDRDDRMVSTGVNSDSEVQITVFAYDPRNRLTTIARPDSSEVAMEWDLDSNLAGWEDENGIVVEQSHDDRGLVTLRSVTGSTHGADEEAFEYDGAGRLTLAESSRSGELLAAATWTWNTLHRPESHTLVLGDLNGGTIGSWTTGATWDVHGNLVGETFSDEAMIEFTLDELSRVTAIDTSTETLATYLWAGADRPVNVAFDNGVETAFEYEQGFGGPVASLQHSRGGETLWQTERVHDVRGLPVRERRQHDGATGRALTFDALHRLASVHLGTDLYGTALESAPSDFGMLRGYGLGTFGNRTTVTDSDAGSGTIYEHSYSTDEDGMNRYLVGHDALLAYDGACRVEHDGAAGVYLGWDFMGRPCTVDDAAAFSTPERIARHDAAGTRVFEEEYDDESLVRRTVLLQSPLGRPLEEIELDAENDEIARVQYVHGANGIVAENAGGWRFRHADQDGSLIGLTDEQGRRIAEFDYLPFGAPVRRAIMLDAAPGEVSDVATDTPTAGITRITVSMGLSAGVLQGRELAVVVPGATSDRYRTGAIISNGTGTIDVQDPDDLIADALDAEGKGLLVYRANMSTVTPAWSYDSFTDSSTLTVTGADFSPWLLGGTLTPDVTRPAFLEIIEVDGDGDWLRVQGDATGTSGASDHYRALPPVGVDADGGYLAAESRYLWRGLRHDFAPRIADWTSGSWLNRAGLYGDYDPRIGRRMVPASTWRNPYDFAPWGNLDAVSPTGAPGLRERWSPSPACPAQPRGQRPSRFAAPGLPGWSG